MQKLFIFVFLSYVVFFILFPPFQNPDEQGHYETVYWTSQWFYPYVSLNFIVPKHPYAGDVQQYFSHVIQHNFVIPDYAAIANSQILQRKDYLQKQKKEFLPISNQAYNPPVYYVTAAVFLNLSKFLDLNLLQQFYFTRLTSAFFYFGTIYFAYKILIKLFGNSKKTMGAFLFFALNPIVMQSGIGISPDIAITFFVTAFFYIVATRNIEKRNTIFLLSCVAGVALLTKITAVFLIPAFIYYLYASRKLIRNFLYNSGLFCLTVFIFQIPWMIFNFLRYHTVVVSDIALGIPPKNVHTTFLNAFTSTVFSLRHTIMHFSGFLGWNDSYPFPVVFITFTVLFILFLLAGLVKTLRGKGIYTKFLSISTISLICFFILLGFERAIYFHPGWEIGGRNILPIFLPMIISIYAGIKVLMRKYAEITFVFLYYFSIFYYFYILLTVLVPRYYV